MHYIGISYDSRKVKPGDLFVAIPGFKVDGTQFIPQAIEKGAKVIVSEQKVEVPEGVELQQVPSARQALAHLANKFYDYPSKKLKLIGITGTNGKTTVSYLIESILTEAGFKVGLIGTTGNRILGRDVSGTLTTPESLELQALLSQMVKEGVTHVVMEVSSHALVLDRVYGCDFDIAIFTNLTHDHLDFHGDMNKYLNVKKKLFESLKSDGIAIINVDDMASTALIEAVKGEVIPYGITQSKHELRDTRHNEFDTLVSKVIIKEDEMALNINSFEICTPLIGMHNAYNIAAAFQCALTLGIPQGVIKKGIEKLKRIPGRQERIDCGQPFSIIVDFAHSPDSLQKLIETYRQFTKGKIVLVFGCPGERDFEKRPIMGEIAARLADYVIISTDDPHGEDPGAIGRGIERGIRESGDQEIGERYIIILNRKEAIEKALRMAKAGDTVLIAGRGHEKYQDFAGKKVPIDDREVVRAALRKNVNYENY